MIDRRRNHDLKPNGCVCVQQYRYDADYWVQAERVVCVRVLETSEKSVASPLTFPPSSLSSLRRGGIFARRLITSSSCCQKNRGRPPLQDSFSSSRNVAVDDEDPGVNVIAKAGKNDFARAHTLILRASNNHAR